MDETKKETEQLDALGTVLRQLLIMLKNKQNIESVYNYLDTTHNTETDELKNALKTVFSESVNEIIMKELPEPTIDVTNVDLTLELLAEGDIPEITEVIKRCYSGTGEMDKLLYYWDFRGFSMSDCRIFYKIVQSGDAIGAVNLAYVGMEAMLIRSLAYNDPDNNAYIRVVEAKISPHHVLDDTQRY